MALLMGVFLFSLIGIPLTAGFAGKLLLFWGGWGCRRSSWIRSGDSGCWRHRRCQRRYCRLVLPADHHGHVLADADQALGEEMVLARIGRGVGLRRDHIGRRSLSLATFAASIHHHGVGHTNGTRAGDDRSVAQAF